MRSILKPLFVVCLLLVSYGSLTAFQCKHGKKSKDYFPVDRYPKAVADLLRVKPVVLTSKQAKTGNIEDLYRAAHIDPETGILAVVLFNRSHKRTAGWGKKFREYTVKDERVALLFKLMGLVYLDVLDLSKDCALIKCFARAGGYYAPRVTFLTKKNGFAYTFSGNELLSPRELSRVQCKVLKTLGRGPALQYYKLLRKLLKENLSLSARSNKMPPLKKGAK